MSKSHCGILMSFQTTKSVTKELEKELLTTLRKRQQRTFICLNFHKGQFYIKTFFRKENKNFKFQSVKLLLINPDPIRIAFI